MSEMTFCVKCAENVWHPLDTHRCKVHREGVNPVTGHRKMRRCEDIRAQMGDVCPKYKEKPQPVRFRWTTARLLIGLGVSLVVGSLIAWLLS